LAITYLSLVRLTPATIIWYAANLLKWARRIPFRCIQNAISRPLICYLAFGCPGACFADSTTDIYLSYDPQGIPRFSNQAYDATYRLFLRADLPDHEAKTMAPNRQLVEKLAAQKEIAYQTRIAAQKYGVEPALIFALINRESGFNMNAISRKGAIGAMQLLPETAKRYGTRAPAIAAQNIDAGTHYLRDLLRLFDGNLALALAAYNAGEGSVNRHGKNIPPFKETMLYVPSILTKYQEYKSVISMQEPTVARTLQPTIEIIR